jgi:glycosyltransferase involved in cell wall biosynthesis
VKISLYGADFSLGQLPRIREALVELGHNIVFVFPDLIYANDAGGFQEAIAQKQRFPKAKLILNILDIPSFLPEIKNILEKLKWTTAFADKVTCISETVRADILKYLHIRADCIYNPIMDVEYRPGTLKTIPFLYVGRANAFNKRFYLVKQTLELMGMPSNSLVVVGSEAANFGYNAGIVNLETLTELYNSTRYVFFPSEFEGLGLPACESLVCKSVPIACSDCNTSIEFLPPDCLFDSTPEALSAGINKLEENYRENVERFYTEYGVKYKEQFDKKTIARNILEVYKKIK